MKDDFDFKWILNLDNQTGSDPTPRIRNAAKDLIVLLDGVDERGALAPVRLLHIRPVLQKYLEITNVYICCVYKM